MRWRDAQPRFWYIFALSGLVVGFSIFTLVYAEGFSYLSDDPQVCGNCHIMNDHIETWLHGPHRHVATCTECHLPSSFVAKYVAKARNGWHHSIAFTLQSARPDSPGERRYFVEPIQIKPFNRNVLEKNCLRCHEDLVRDIVRTDPEPIQCTLCHKSAGHGASF